MISVNGDRVVYIVSLQLVWYVWYNGLQRRDVIALLFFFLSWVVCFIQGCSERNISCVVEQREGAKALRAVHAAFLLSHLVSEPVLRDRLYSPFRRRPVPCAVIRTYG